MMMMMMVTLSREDYQEEVNKADDQVGAGPRIRPPQIIIIITIVMVTQHIPAMTKSHHGGNMSVMIKMGMCQCQNPTIHDKIQLGPVGSGKLFKSAPVL